MSDQRPRRIRPVYRLLLQALVFLFALLMLAWWLFPGFFAKVERENHKVQAEQSR